MVEATLVVGSLPLFGEDRPVDHVPAADEPVGPYKDVRAIVVAEFERSYLTRLLAEANGNVSQAARIAKMDRSHLIDLLRRHQLKT